MNRFRPQLLLIILTLAVGAYAQKPQAARIDQSEANLRRHIEYLASDKLEGRRAGEAGAALAAHYIEKQFAAVGLHAGAKAKNGTGSYLQRFPYIAGVEMAKTGNDFSLAANGVQIDAIDPAIKPVGFSPNAAVKNAPAVFAGFGIVSKESEYDDYTYAGNALDVKGKVVLIFDGNPDNDNPHSPYGRFDVRTKALIAKEHGAVGMILISREDKFSDERLARMGYDQSLGEAALPTFIASRGLAVQILGIEEGGLKTFESSTGLKTKTGVDVKVPRSTTQSTVTFAVNLIKKSVDAYNVIGIQPGTDRTLKNEAIVIGAHYDHLGHGGSGSLAANSTEIHHGADDNASGVAAIIEMARQFALERKNKRTLIFIAFSGEEEGLFGSNFYVNNPVFPLENTAAMINLDMVGRLTDWKLTIGGIGTASEFRQLVGAQNPMGQARPVDATTNLDPASLPPSKRLFTLQLNEDGFGPSDHSSFYGKKVPVLFFFTGTHNDYHKPSDTSDKINYGGEHAVLYYVQDIVQAIDQGPVKPTYTVAKTTMLGGRSGFNISLGTIPNYADSTDGLLLDGVRDNSPASKAGVKAGDKVVNLAGHDIRNVMDYTYVLGEMKAGDEYEIVVLRDTEKMTFKIVPVKR